MKAKSNSFKFKQFNIDDSGSAMKVGTDSIMLGSWACVGDAKHILDIGSGSGLLAIMLAQKASVECNIIGIDIDTDAVQQAYSNAKNSPWVKQLNFQKIALQDYQSKQKFDLVISNPPYFPVNHKANTRARGANRIDARQTVELDHGTLLKHVSEHLSDKGVFYCILPADVADAFVRFAESSGLYREREMYVQAKPKGRVIRHLLSFRRDKKVINSEKIIIYNELLDYSAEYIELCKEYYLNF